MSVIKLDQVQLTGVPRMLGAPAAGGRRMGPPPMPAPLPAGPAAEAPAPVAAAATDELHRLRSKLEALQRSQREYTERQQLRARSELAQAVAQARAEGLAAGREQAERDEQARVAALREAALRAADAARAAQADVEALALGVARLALRSLLGDERWRAEALALAVRKLCEDTRGSGPVALRLAAEPWDVGETELLRRELAQTPAGPVGLQVDPALPPGTCLVEMDGRSLDASLARQLAHVEGLLAREAARG